MVCERFQKKVHLAKMLLLILPCLLGRVTSETGDCREHEFMDHTGNCIPCKQCGPGKELSKECGFGYGEDAQCMTCRLNRFKEDWGFQKCRACLDCALVNRFQKANCSATSNAACGDCLPGFYRKTKLGGFQDMECVPCGDPPPSYEPHCTTKVNLVKIPSTASSPRDTALAAVICSALATVLLALLILCVIYCKRQFMEKKPSWSTRSQDVQFNGSELSCFDRPWINECAPRTCCQCQQNPTQTCGPVPLIPSLCCDDTSSMENSRASCSFPSQSTLHERNADSLGEMIPAFMGSVSNTASEELAEAWPLMQTLSGKDTVSCESYPEPTGRDSISFHPETMDKAALESDCDKNLGGLFVSGHSHSINSVESIKIPDENRSPDVSLALNPAAVENQSNQECEDTVTVIINSGIKDA
ncbi:tumor necrosis factor receptor superfamily member 19 [Rhinatrema bivittatum]|uniref:tumor necrosis factor receptor superfamily member 19 n=1 Tax=Rhinatrema bivittatum TaxID=194408 RepID=UPI00112891E6|nr:tumor necrosis factor receptor superfamily member 19 [Rhinatrema bivittatum]XP_029458405.1 tumor necrosis factor receptor superfamily member 19 [Rhinatrema bivittatum]